MHYLFMNAIQESFKIWKLKGCIQLDSIEFLVNYVVNLDQQVSFNERLDDFLKHDGWEISQCLPDLYYVLVYLLFVHVVLRREILLYVF